MINDFNEGRYNNKNDDEGEENLEYDNLKKRRERKQQEGDAIKRAIAD
jgi:hypothetical protein